MVAQNHNGINGQSGGAASALDFDTFLTDRDAWLLSRLRSGFPNYQGQPISLTMLDSDELRKALANQSGSSSLDAAFSAFLLTQSQDFQKAAEAKIFAQDPTDQGEPKPQAATPPAPPRYVVRSIDESLDLEEEISWVVAGVLSEGSVSLWFGKPGAKKTWLALDLAIHIAAGRDWLGKEVEQGPVLILDEESGPRRMRRRLRSLLNGHQLGKGLQVNYISLALFNLARPIRPTTWQHVQQQSQSGSPDILLVADEIERIKPKLVIVDALVDVSGGADENSASEMQILLQNLRFLAEKNDCAIILIHHAGKAGNYRGSSAIMGAVDLALEISSESESPNLDAKSEKTRDVEHFRFSAAFWRDDLNDSVDFHATGCSKSNGPKLSDAEEYVINWLTLNGQQTMTEIKSNADVCSAPTAERTVYRLKKRGLIVRTDKGGSGKESTWAIAPVKSP